MMFSPLDEALNDRHILSNDSARFWWIMASYSRYMNRRAINPRKAPISFIQSLPWIVDHFDPAGATIMIEILIVNILLNPEKKGFLDEIGSIVSLRPRTVASAQGSVLNRHRNAAYQHTKAVWK